MYKECYFVLMKDIIKIDGVVIICLIIILIIIVVVYYILGVGNCVEFFRNLILF